MKFKVGDKVRLIKCTECTNGFKEGQTCKIIEIDSEGVYRIRITNGKYYGYVDEEHIQKVEYTKSDLKDGDIVTYRTGRKRIVQGERLIQMDGNNGYNLNAYRDDLTEKNNDRDLDIIKVERPLQYKTVFERKEEILDETEKKYLRDVIRPFRDKVGHIRKQSFFRGDYITINVKHDNSEEGIDLPYFNKNTMYKGMNLNKEYTLEELRTIKE